MEKKRGKSGPKPAIEITGEFLDKVEDLSRKQFTQEQIRGYFGVKKACWYKYCKDHPEIRMRVKKGRNGGLEYVVSKLLEKIEQGDTKCILFYLERKGKWKELKNLNLDAKLQTEQKPSAELKITTTDPQEASRIYQQIMTTGS
jgi:hypothetical protein